MQEAQVFGVQPVIVACKNHLHPYWGDDAVAVVDAVPLLDPESDTLVFQVIDPTVYETVSTPSEAEAKHRRGGWYIRSRAFRTARHAAK